MPESTDSAAADDPGATEQQLSDIGKAAAKAAEEAIAKLEAKLKTLEGRAQEAAKDAEVIRDDLVAETERRVRDNPLGALFTALGVGFILGLLFGVGRGR